MAGSLAFGNLESTRAAPKVSAADAEALQLLLLVERAELAFYEAALGGGELDGELRSYAETVLTHERAHVAYLERLTERRPRSPDFEFGDSIRAASFPLAAAQLEDVAVAAYNGQATGVSSELLVAASSIVSVEARHAAWIRSVAGRPPAPDATDRALSASQVVDQLEQLGVRP